MAALKAEQLDSHLARQLSPVYTLHGDEPLIALEAADAIRARARAQGFSERSVFVADRSFKWAELTAAGASMSLFGERKLIELRIPTGKPGTEGAESIQQYCATAGSDTLLMVSLPRLLKRDQSAAWFTALGNAGVVVEVYPIERSRLPEWISGRLARQKQRAGRETLQFLADSVEGNLLAAHQEIQKLALLFSEGELPDEAVRDAVLNVARYDVNRLGDAMLSGDAGRVTRVLDGLRAEGEAPPRLVWVLAEELRGLARIHEGLAQGRSFNDLCRENRVWGEPRTSIVRRAAQRLDRRSIEAALSHAARIDRVGKGIGKGDAWDELLSLGTRFATAP